MDDAVIRLRHVCKSFDSKVALEDVSFDIPRGRTTAVIGPSGSGKSVLIKHVVGLLEPDSGEIWVGDIDMARAKVREKYAIRRRFGMLFQEGALFDSYSAGENVAFPLRYHTKLSEAEMRRIAEEKLALVELEGLYDRPTNKLSGGQRKRVGLARAIVMEPEVVIFDEPNSGLDPLTSDTIDDLIGRMKQQLGITFIVITHDIVSTVKIADYVAMLFEGRLVELGPKEDFLRIEKDIVRRFLARNLGAPDEQGEAGPKRGPAAPRG